MYSASKTLKYDKNDTSTDSASKPEAIDNSIPQGISMNAQDIRQRGVDLMKSVITDLKYGRQIQTSGLTIFAKDLVIICRENEEEFPTLARLKDPCNYPYSHPVNVSIYSIAIGSKLRYNDRQLNHLGLAGLLHDIGEIKLPDRMLVKSAKYTESEHSAMQRHPELGYEVLKKDTSISDDVLVGILHHHERLDGSGYPSGHVGRFIHPMGKIIGVAEAFDAMTSDRASASGKNSTDVIKAIYSQSGKQFEPKVVKALIMVLGMYPVGSLVRLSGGQLAVVVRKNKRDLSLPDVVVVTDSFGQPISPYFITLYGDKNGRQILYPENPVLLNINTEKYIEMYAKNQIKE